MYQLTNYRKIQEEIKINNGLKFIDLQNSDKLLLDFIEIINTLIDKLITDYEQKNHVIISFSDTETLRSLYMLYDDWSVDESVIDFDKKNLKMILNYSVFRLHYHVFSELAQIRKQ